MQFIKIIFVVFFIALCSCEKNLMDDNSSTTNNKMYVYQNSGTKLYLVDYKTFQVIRDIDLKFPFQTSNWWGLELSTNHNYLIGEGIVSDSPTDKLYFYSYDIKNDRIHNYFNTGLIADGTPSFKAANIPSNPGLAYFNHRSMGLYSFNFLNKKNSRTPI